MAFLGRAWVIFCKDLAREWRRREVVNPLLFVAGLLLLLFQFALGRDRELLRAALPGLIWLAFILSALLAAGRGSVLELEDDCRDALLLAPGDKSAIYVGKVAGNLVIMGALQWLLLALFALVYDVDAWGALPGLAMAMTLGTVGLGAAGTLFAALTARARARELLLPVLLLPLQVPLLLGTVRVAAAVLDGEPLGEVAHWLQLLAVADIVYVVLGMLTFEVVLEV